MRHNPAAGAVVNRVRRPEERTPDLETIIKPGQFSMEIPGQISAEINNPTHSNKLDWRGRHRNFRLRLRGQSPSLGMANRNASHPSSQLLYSFSVTESRYKPNSFYGKLVNIRFPD
jgi:hypothetical protein